MQRRMRFAWFSKGERTLMRGTNHMCAHDFHSRNRANWLHPLPAKGAARSRASLGWSLLDMALAPRGHREAAAVTWQRTWADCEARVGWGGLFLQLPGVSTGGRSRHILGCVLLCCVFQVVSDSLQPHGLKPTRLLCPWNFPSISSSRGSFQPRDQTCISCISRWIL